MMSPDNNSTLRNPHVKESSTGKKSSSSTKTQQQASASQQPHLNCPRCDSPNTKFCYYNNYSLSQPRHFCKTCRRYWTKGGALRNVPVGGGCRKNKKMRNLASSRVSGDHSNDGSVSSDQFGGLKFFHGVSPPTDFQLGGLLHFPRLQSPSAAGSDLFHHHHHHQFSSYAAGLSNNACGPAIPASFSLDPPGNSPAFMGLSSFPLPAARFQEMGSSSFNNNPSLASSIESLSSINQDLHWKLQQQRLAMLYVGDDGQKETINTATTTYNSLAGVETLVQKPQPILFQNLETESCGLGTSRKDSGGGDGTSLATEWFFDNSVASSVNPIPATSGSNVIMNNESTGTNWNSGIIQAWSDLTNYSALP